MTADHCSAAVGDGDVQMGAIGSEGAAQAEDLQIAGKRAAFLLAGQPQLGSAGGQSERKDPLRRKESD